MSSPTPNHEPTHWSPDFGGMYFELQKVDAGQLLVLKEGANPSTQQMRALYGASDAQLLAGRETEYAGRDAFHLFDHQLPLNALADHVQTEWEQEITAALATVSDLSDVPPEMLRPYLLHSNFPLKGVSPIRISPAFIDAIEKVQQLGSRTVQN